MTTMASLPGANAIVRSARNLALIAATVLVTASGAIAATTEVSLISSSDYYYSYQQFSPSTVTINVGDSVQWSWESGPHSVTSGTPNQPSGLFNSGIHSVGYSFSQTFTQSGNFPYYCMVHGAMMTGTVKVVVPPPAALVNLSTRMRVETGDSVLIAGFIIDGSGDKSLALRGLGPSLNVNGQPISGTLPNPLLELHDQSGKMLKT